MEQSSIDTNNQQERFDTLHWLAGFFEGEGCVGLYLLNKQRKHKGNIRIHSRIAMVNSEQGFIERASKILTNNDIGHYIYHREVSKYGPKWKDVKVISITGMKRVVTFLKAILPYLTNGTRKHEAAKLTLEYCEKRLSLPHNNSAGIDEFSYVERVRDLNKKGPQISSETLR